MIGNIKVYVDGVDLSDFVTGWSLDRDTSLVPGSWSTVGAGNTRSTYYLKIELAYGEDQVNQPWGYEVKGA